MQPGKRLLVAYLAPSLIVYLLAFILPVILVFVMSFFKFSSIKSFTFIGFEN